MIQILLTFDLELFLGNKIGTVENCIYKPTLEILNILKKYQIPGIFFVDAGYLLALKEKKRHYVELQRDYDLFLKTLNLISKSKSFIELHLHPQWIKSVFKNGRWYLNNKLYRIQDFNENERKEIITESVNLLENVSENKIVAFRAGGWCIEPFYKIKYILEDLNIFIDSSVFYGGCIKTNFYSINFKNVPKKDLYPFSDTPLKEDPNGKFLEVPITSYKYTPLFYLKFLLSKKLKKQELTQFGDGCPIKSKFFNKLKYFLKSHYYPVSLDLYRASALKNALEIALKNENKFFVIMSHPKRMSCYSMKKMEEFIADCIKKHFNFISYRDISKNYLKSKI